MLSTMQKDGVDKIMEWFKGDEQAFVLAGYAGTGKTFIVQYIMQELGIPMQQVGFMAFTGKASLVLTQKANGMFTCHTCHHTLYEPQEQPDGTVTFSLKRKSEFKHIKLFVVDECSMLTEEILNDLYSLGKKILFVGDHGQLEPIGKQTWLYQKLQDADFTLTEIHRQAEGNPIIHLSMLARQGKKIALGKYEGGAYVVSKREIDKSKGLQKSLLSADQVICGYNKTRSKYNKLIREKLGFTNLYPQNGDKLICLRNNWKKEIAECALVNGLVGTVEYVKYQQGGNGFRQNIQMNFKPDFTENQFFGVRTLPEVFKGEDFPQLGRNDYDKYDEFDFGYAITCHKAQGSQWDNLMVISEPFGDEPNRWLYTAITRASKKLILAK